MAGVGLRADAPSFSVSGGAGTGVAWSSLPKPTQRLPGALVAFLPQDNDETSEVAAAATAALNEALGHLLALPPPQFWAHVAHEPQLPRALDTYLRFRRRPHDGGSQLQSSASGDALSRRVFMLLLRCASPGERGGPPPEAQTALLRQHALLSAPRLLDACALFGPDNGELTARLLRDALALAPWLLLDAAAMGAAAGASVAELVARCDAALAPGSASAEELADAVAYFCDVGASLAAFARAAPQAAPSLLAGEGATLLPALAAAHDRVCPAVARAAPLLASAAGRAQVAARDACATLLQAAYLSPRGGGEAARAARREGLFLLALACGAADAPAGGRGLLRCAASAPGFQAALARADLAMDSEQRAVVHAAFGAADAAEAAPAPADPMLASRVAAVRDVLPDLGHGFVAACLAALGNDPEAVVHALLEGALPASVSGLDQRMSLEQFTASAAPQPKPAVKPSAPAPRPAATPPNMQALLKKGERHRWERDEGVQILNERDAVAASVALARASAFEEEDAAAAKAQPAFDAYDDEYDDSYDDLVVHCSEAATDADGDGDAEANAPQPAARPAAQPTARGPAGRGAPPKPAPATPVPAPRPQQAAAAGGRQSKFWLLDGRVYSYAKAGAEAVSAASAEEAAQLAVARAAESASLIHGLGAGGNRGVAEASSSDEEGEEGPADAGGAPGGGRGRGRGRGGPPPADSARARARKEQAGNRHRSGAASKQQRALLGPT